MPCWASCGCYDFHPCHDGESYVKSCFVVAAAPTFALVLVLLVVLLIVVVLPLIDVVLLLVSLFKV